MTTQARRRLAALESLPAPERIQTPEEMHVHNVTWAARCGLTEEQVMAQFGGWPAFAHAWLMGTVVDPTERRAGSGEFDELLAKYGGDGMRAYMAMIGVGRGRY
jgi:hypothetical protein